MSTWQTVDPKLGKTERVMGVTMVPQTEICVSKMCKWCNPSLPVFVFCVSFRPLFKHVTNASHGGLFWMSLNEQERASSPGIHCSWSAEKDISSVTRLVCLQATTAFSYSHWCRKKMKVNQECQDWPQWNWSWDSGWSPGGGSMVKFLLCKHVNLSAGLCTHTTKA